MHTCLRGICSLIALASGESTLGHLSLVQHSAGFRTASMRRSAVDSGKQEDEIATDWPSMRKASLEARHALRFLQTDGGEGKPECSLLAFVPVGSFEQAGQLLKGNLERMRATLQGSCEVTVFVNHYDGQKDYWQEQTNTWENGWYDRHVQHSAQMPGFKFQVMQELLRHVDLDSFTWVWALDEDFNILHTDVARVLQLAEKSGALISIPAFTQAGETDKDRELDFPMQGPNPQCLYRYADVVEVIFPLFRTAALKTILWNCDHCIGNRTVWGLCRMWCSYSARKLGHDRSTACAIIDGAPMVHQNFKTLTNKYDSSGKAAPSAKKETKAFINLAMSWSAEVRNMYSEHYVAGNSTFMNSTRCVRA